MLTRRPDYPNLCYQSSQGVGMTSQRTRDRLVKRLMTEYNIDNIAVLNAIRVTPRHLFVDEAMATRAYEDTALPIGFGQTLSQPWVVAKMTQWLLKDKPLNKVLEIGTGSGYQTSILSLVSNAVFSVERIAPLQEKAKGVLTHLELNNIEFSLSDGHWGWDEFAPYDAIISAASPETVPEELISQLAVGGRLVMPIGGAEQMLYGFTKTASGIQTECLGEVLFVPMKTGIEY